MRIQHLMAGMALMAMLCSCDWTVLEQQIPETFELQCSNPTLNVFGGTVDVAVTCNLPWSVSLESESWGKITQVDKEKGTISFEADFYNAAGVRSNNLIVRAGIVTKQFTLQQTGTDQVFSPSQIVLKETDPSELSFSCPGHWTATLTDEDSWIVLSSTEGEGGLVQLSLSAADPNEQVGPREGKVHFHFGGSHTLDLTVLQWQKNVILVDAEPASLGFHGGEITVLTRSNIPYKVTCQEDWITPSTTKAPLNESSEVFTIGENLAPGDRTGQIVFYYSDADGTLMESFTVVQRGRDAFLDNRNCGVYGVPGMDPCQYVAGASQLSRLKKTDGTRSFRILFPAMSRVVELDGLPLTMAPGDSLLFQLSVKELGETLSSSLVSCEVLEVEGGLAWLKADAQTGFVIQY